jgi:hypothetical protein
VRAKDERSTLPCSYSFIFYYDDDDDDDDEEEEEEEEEEDSGRQGVNL